MLISTKLLKTVFRCVTQDKGFQNCLHYLFFFSYDIFCVQNDRLHKKSKIAYLT